MSRMTWGMLALAIAAVVVLLAWDRLPVSKPEGLVPAAIPGSSEPAPRDPSVPTLGREMRTVRAKPVMESVGNAFPTSWAGTGSERRINVEEGEFSASTFEPPGNRFSESPFQRAMSEDADRARGFAEPFANPSAPVAAAPAGASGATTALPHRATYRTQAGDSFWTICESHYGDGGYYRALYAHNRQLIARPDQIEPGILIETPRVGELRRLYPELCPAL